MPTTNRVVHLKSTPQGTPTEDNFEIRSSDLGDPTDGQVLIQNIYMSVDPYMRGRMNEGWRPGDALGGGALGKVIVSNNDNFAVGDYVLNQAGWHEYLLSDGRGISTVDPELAPLSSYLGVMGMPGLTAYGGLLVTGEYKDGETVFVSAASGAVGSVVGQIAKIKGGRAIGSAGSDEKVQELMDEFGFDHAFNYKTADPLTELRKGAPEGLDVYFENVGGAQLEAALFHMRPYGRIPICGMIAHYNDKDGSITPGPRNLTQTIYKFVSLKGFVVSAFEGNRAQFLQDMSGWIKSGEMKYHETIHNGIDNAASAFIGLFSGSNNGKMLVKLADE
jgi:NADPH-dependent curcumin reductase CurA